VDAKDTQSANPENIDRHLDMLRGAVHGLGGRVEVVGVQEGVCTVRYQGPRPIGEGLRAAVKDQFRTIKEVVLVPFGDS